MSALVLRIKFPQTYPLIYKTLRVDPNLTVAEAVVYIAQTVSAPPPTQGAGIGLFVPSQKKWLTENEPLSTYSSLQEEVLFSLLVFSFFFSVVCCFYFFKKKIFVFFYNFMLVLSLRASHA